MVAAAWVVPSKIESPVVRNPLFQLSSYLVSLSFLLLYLKCLALFFVDFELGLRFYVREYMANLKL